MRDYPICRPTISSTRKKRPHTTETTREYRIIKFLTDNYPLKYTAKQIYENNPYNNDIKTTEYVLNTLIKDGKIVKETIDRFNFYGLIRGTNE